VNCDSPGAAQAVADPEFFFGQVKRPIVIFDEVHQLPDPRRLLKIAADEFPTLKIVATGSSTLATAKKFRLFWRDHQQREVDFVVPRGRDTVDAYECTWSALRPDVTNLPAFRASYPKGLNLLVVPQISEPVSLKIDGLAVEIVTPAHLMARAEG
jgi:hypothetical protein